MKKLINLLSLAMLLSVNVLTPISYATENLWETGIIPENGSGIAENVGGMAENGSGMSENDSSASSWTDLKEQNGDPQDSSPKGSEWQAWSWLYTSASPQNDDDGVASNPEDENFTEWQILDHDRGWSVVNALPPEVVYEIVPISLIREWELDWHFVSLFDAINTAENWDVIELNMDIFVSEALTVEWKSITINGNNHTITRTADITTFTVNENSSLELIDVTITDNAVNFAPNRYDSLIRLHTHYIYFCTWWVIETRDESWEVISSVCDTMNVDTAKTHPQIYSVWDIYGDNLTISNSLNSKWSAAIIAEKWWIEMINSKFIHNWASGTSHAWRGWAIRVWPNTATNIVDESPITKILFSWCLFESNYGRAYWWALAIHYAPEVVTIDNCIFSGNTAYLNWWAIHIPNIWSNPTGYLPQLPNESSFPVGTLYVNNSDFYNNRCGNDWSAIENDDLFLKVDSSNFEHNYWTWPENQSVWVISCQVWWANRRIGRWLIRRNYEINNSSFRDSNTVVLWDHWRAWWFIVDNCTFENQSKVILTYNWRWEIKNSTIKNSNPFWYCGEKWRFVYDFQIIPDTDYYSIVSVFWESTFKLENNVYINDCINEYKPVYSFSYASSGKNNIIIDDKNVKVVINRSKSYYDIADIQWTDEIYYGAAVYNDEWAYAWKWAYIKKNKFYNFDEFNNELLKFSNSYTGYQLEPWKAMLFYLDTGYTELWSGSINKSTYLYWREVDIYNIIYEWMEWVDFEWITHTNKFVPLNHTQYLTEFTPYILNNPIRNWYEFEWWFSDSWYVNKITNIGAWSTWDITLYAKWKKKPSSWSWWWGSGWWMKKDNCPDGDFSPSYYDGECGEKPSGSVESNTWNTQDFSADKSASEWQTWSVVDSSAEPQNNSSVSSWATAKDLEWEELFNMHQWAYDNWLTIYAPWEDAKFDQPLTRQQMAKISSIFWANFLNQKADDSEWKVYECSQYKDLSKSKWEMRWYVVQSCLLWNMWYAYDRVNLIKKFKPYDKMSVAQASVILSRMVWWTKYVISPKMWYQWHMQAVYDHGLIDDISNPQREITRWEAFMMMYRLDKLMNSEKI